MNSGTHRLRVAKDYDAVKMVLMSSLLGETLFYFFSVFFWDAFPAAKGASAPKAKAATSYWPLRQHFARKQGAVHAAGRRVD